MQQLNPGDPERFGAFLGSPDLRIGQAAACLRIAPHVRCSLSWIGGRSRSEVDDAANSPRSRTPMP